jgi:DNA-binding NarL/FixJ family response regulator
MALDLRIALIDSDPDIRHGRRLLIDSQPDLQVVFEDDNATTTIQRLPEALVDVVVLDHRIKGLDGIEVAKALIRAYLGDEARVPQIIMTGPYFSPELQIACIAAGATDLVTQDSGPEELLKAIRSTAAKDDEPDFRELAAFLEAAGHISIDVPDLLVRLGQLGERELAVLGQFELGKADEQIAEEMFLAKYRVRQILNSVVAKAGFATRTQLFLALHRAGRLDD